MIPNQSEISEIFNNTKLTDENKIILVKYIVNGGIVEVEDYNKLDDFQLRLIKYAFEKMSYDTAKSLLNTRYFPKDIVIEILYKELFEESSEYKFAEFLIKEAKPTKVDSKILQNIFFRESEGKLDIDLSLVIKKFECIDFSNNLFGVIFIHKNNNNIIKKIVETYETILIYKSILIESLDYLNSETFILLLERSKIQGYESKENLEFLQFLDDIRYSVVTKLNNKNNSEIPIKNLQLIREYLNEKIKIIGNKLATNKLLNHDEFMKIISSNSITNEEKDKVRSYIQNGGEIDIYFLTQDQENNLKNFLNPDIILNATRLADDLIILYIKYNGHLDAIELLKNKFKIINNEYFIYYFATKGNLEIVKLLVEKGFEYNKVYSIEKMTALLSAIHHNKYDVANYLIEQSSIKICGQSFFLLLNNIKNFNIDTETIIKKLDPKSYYFVLNRLEALKQSNDVKYTQEQYDYIIKSLSARLVKEFDISVNSKNCDYNIKIINNAIEYSDLSTIELLFEYINEHDDIDGSLKKLMEFANFVKQNNENSDNIDKICKFFDDKIKERTTINQSKIGIDFKQVKIIEAELVRPIDGQNQDISDENLKRFKICLDNADLSYPSTYTSKQELEDFLDIFAQNEKNTEFARQYQHPKTKYTFIHLAVMCSSPSAVKHFFSEENYPIKGVTPLYLSLYYKHPTITKLLLEKLKDNQIDEPSVKYISKIRNLEYRNYLIEIIGKNTYSDLCLKYNIIPNVNLDANYNGAQQEVFPHPTEFLNKSNVTSTPSSPIKTNLKVTESINREAVTNSTKVLLLETTALTGTLYIPSIMNYLINERPNILTSKISILHRKITDVMTTATEPISAIINNYLHTQATTSLQRSLNIFTDTCKSVLPMIVMTACVTGIYVFAKSLYNGKTVIDSACITGREVGKTSIESVLGVLGGAGTTAITTSFGATGIALPVIASFASIYLASKAIDTATSYFK